MAGTKSQKRVTLNVEITGALQGKTIKLAGVQFVEGRSSLTGMELEMRSLLRYLNKCWQVEEVRDGTNDVQKTTSGGEADKIPGAIRENKPGSSEKSPNDDLDGGGSDPDGAGYEDSGVDTSGEKYDNTAQSKVNVPRLKKAMARLRSWDDEHWTEDGRPRLDVVTRFYGNEGLTRNDLDVIWPDFDRNLQKSRNL